MRSKTSRSAAAALVALALARCTPPAEAPPSPADATGADLPAVVRAHIDSAEVAWKAGDATLARAHFRIARDSVPDLAAAWFGLYLTNRALGDTAASDSALRHARRIARADSVAPRS